MKYVKLPKVPSCYNVFSGLFCGVHLGVPIINGTLVALASLHFDSALLDPV